MAWNITTNAGVRITDENSSSLSQYMSSTSSDFPVNSTSTNVTVVDTNFPLWHMILLEAQFAMTTLGALCNLLTMVALSQNNGIFGIAAQMVLRHQAFVDFGVCLMGSLTHVVPLWESGNAILDGIICIAWTYQGIYWLFVEASFCNLVLFTCERYLAVCFPFKHQNIRARHMWVAIAMTYVVGFLIDGSYLVLYLPDCSGKALFSKDTWDKYNYHIMAVHTLNYLLPSISLTILYSQILCTLHRRGQDSRMATSRLIDRAKRDLTRSAIVITTIFVMCTAYEFVTFFLGLSELIEYTYNSPSQMVGVFLIGFNSFANPVVYFILMPAYRGMLKRTFYFCCRKPELSRGEIGQSVQTISSSLPST